MTTIYQVLVNDSNSIVTLIASGRKKLTQKLILHYNLTEEEIEELIITNHLISGNNSITLDSTEIHPDD